MDNEGLDQVGSTDDPHQFASTQYRYPLDAVPLHEGGNLCNIVVMLHFQHIARHYVCYGPAVLAYVFARQLVAGRSQFLRGATNVLAAKFGTPEQVAFADHAHDSSIRHDGNAADPTRGEQRCKLDNTHIRSGRNDIRRHDFSGQHSSSLI